MADIVNNLLNKISTEFTPTVGADSLMEVVMDADNALQQFGAKGAESIDELEIPIENMRTEFQKFKREVIEAQDAFFQKRYAMQDQFGFGGGGIGNESPATQQVREVNTLTDAVDRNTYAWRANITEARGMRYAGLEIIGILGMLSIAFGDQLSPAMKEVEKSAMIITSGGLASSMLGLGPLPGMLAAGFVALGIGLLTVDENTQALQKNLESLAKKDTLIDTLSTILDLSNQEATALYDLAKASPQAADDLSKLVTNTEKLNGAQTYVEGITIAFQMLSDAIGKATGGLDMLPAMLTAMGASATQWNQLVALVDDYRRKNREAAEAALERDRAEQNAKEREKTSLRDLNSAVKALETENKSAALQSASAWESYQKSLANIEFQHTQQQIKDSNRYITLKQEENESIANAIQRRDDRITDINQRADNQRLDADHQYQNELASLDDRRAKNAEDLAYKLFEIERARVDKISDLDFKTAVDISKAKTEHEVADIQFKALHEESVINRNADNQRTDAYHRAQTQAEIDLKSLDDFTKQYEYRKTVIDRDATQQIQITQRIYNQQTEAAQDSFNKQKLALDQSVVAQDTAYQHQKDQAKLTYDDIIGKIAAKQAADLSAINVAQAAFNLASNARQQMLKDEDALVNNLRRDYGSLGTAGSSVGSTGGGNGLSPVLTGAMSLLTAGASNVVINAPSWASNYIQDLVNKLMSSGAFRDGVQVVVNDVMQQ